MHTKKWKLEFSQILPVRELKNNERNQVASRGQKTASQLRTEERKEKKAEERREKRNKRKYKKKEKNRRKKIKEIRETNETRKSKSKGTLTAKISNFKLHTEK